MSSKVEAKVVAVLDELHAQVEDGYTQPVNGWTTLKQEATTKILKLIQQEVVAGRIDSLLDLEQWLKLHDLGNDMVYEGIEHMCISMLQAPDQPHPDHKDRIKQLKANQLKEDTE